MNKDLHFTNETSREDLKMFVDSLPVSEIKYRGLMKAYSEYLIHEVYTDKYVMQFPKRYFSKKEKKEKITKRRRSVDGGTTKKERKSKWTEEETKALLNGIKNLVLVIGVKFTMIIKKYSLKAILLYQICVLNLVDLEIFLNGDNMIQNSKTNK